MRAHGSVNYVFVIGACLLLCACYAAMALLPGLIRSVTPFLAIYGMACLLYGGAVWWIARVQVGKRALVAIFILAVLFRATMLFSGPPSLSSDVYRYIWDGRVMNAGVNPYADPVNSSQLDWLDSPERGLVNHSWMASPYLPFAQLLFAGIYALAPDSPLAFQVVAVALDLLTGVVVADLLRRLGLDPARALIYLWNPLVVVEFAHGAHVDSLMIFLVMAALWALVAARSRVGSGLALAAATLTKGLPALLAPVLIRRWGWRGTLVYIGAAVALCVPFVLGPGLGLTGPLDGTGLLGPVRIYASRWNYNGGLYHWLEVAIADYPTEGAVPPEVVGEAPIWAAKLIVALVLGVILLVAWRRARDQQSDLGWLRLALLPLGGYLLLTTTVHPWYVTLVIPLLPFLLDPRGADGRAARFLAPWLAFAALVTLSYLTYLDPENLREYEAVRLAEYVPLYLSLAWAARPASDEAATPGSG